MTTPAPIIVQDVRPCLKRIPLATRRLTDKQCLALAPRMDDLHYHGDRPGAWRLFHAINAACIIIESAPVGGHRL